MDATGVTAAGVVLAGAGTVGLLVLVARAAAWAMFAVAALMIGAAGAAGWAVRRVAEALPARAATGGRHMAASR